MRMNRMNWSGLAYPTETQDVFNRNVNDDSVCFQSGRFSPEYSTATTATTSTTATTTTTEGDSERQIQFQ